MTPIEVDYFKTPETPSDAARELLDSVSQMFSEEYPGEQGTFNELISNIISNEQENFEALWEKEFSVTPELYRSFSYPCGKESFLFCVAYCANTIQEEKAGSLAHAWYLVGQAKYWFGVIIGGFRMATMEKEDRSEQLGKNGRRVHEKRQPVKDLAINLVKVKQYPSASEAARRIKPELMKLAEQIGWRVSQDGIEDTIKKWFREAGVRFPGKRAPSMD
jgi:hypothetical protein